VSVPTSEEASERRELRSCAEVPAARKAKVVRRAVKRILVVLCGQRFSGRSLVQGEGLVIVLETSEREGDEVEIKAVCLLELR